MPSSSSSVASGESEANGAPPSIWQFVTLADYTPPPPDVVETAKRRISVLWDRLRPDVEESVPYVKPEDELTGLPEWHLQRAAPPIEWAEAAGALDTALEDWVTDPSPDEPVRLLVTPPCVGRRPIITAWAGYHGWRVLSPPAPEQIPFKTDLTTRAKAALAEMGVAFAALPAVPDAAGLTS